MCSVSVGAIAISGDDGEGSSDEPRELIVYGEGSDGHVREAGYRVGDADGSMLSVSCGSNVTKGRHGTV